MRHCFRTTLACQCWIVSFCGTVTSVPRRAASITVFRIMSDHYVKVKVQLEQMKSFGGDVETEGVDTVEQAPLSFPLASVSPDPSGITKADRDASNTSTACKQRGKSRSKLGKDDNNSNGRHITDVPLHGSVVSAPLGKNLNRLGHERALQVKGTGKILQDKSESNGNSVIIQPPKNLEESRREDALKHGRKLRPVTVDSAKAKTSLEALKLSIKQLKWKEVCCIRFFLAILLFVSKKC